MRKNQFLLEKKVVVITGATGVLGEAFVRGVAEAGGKVVVIGRNKERALMRMKQIEAADGEGCYFLTDVLDEDQLICVREKILGKWGRIDGLVNAAGGNIAGAMVEPDNDLFDLNMKQTQRAIELNLYGTMLPTHVFGKAMALNGSGAIVNISSLAAKSGITRGLGYTVAKTAIEGYTRWMASEMGLRYGGQIRMNAIVPGVFLTKQNHDLLLNQDNTFTERAQKFIDKTPFKRLGMPDELVGALIFLLSDASSFISGETLLVDGGFQAFSGV